MARLAHNGNQTAAHIIASLATLARVITQGNGTYLDKLALFNAVQASEYLARWRMDTTEMSRRETYARAFTVGELASIRSEDLKVTIIREALTAYSKALCNLCQGFDERALAFAETCRTNVARL